MERRDSGADIPELSQDRNLPTRLSSFPRQVQGQGRHLVLEVTFGLEVTTMTSKFIANQVTLSAGAPVGLRHRKYASLPVAPPPSILGGLE